ncbi:MAG: RNA polymerase sigma factor [Flavobacterium sp.]|nr:MAG: RNA polymerase sigma factor [Flavobacterium sp.]
MNQKEFANCLHQFTPELKVAAFRFTHEAEDSDDLVQDTLMKAIRHHDKFEEGSNLKGWLFTILKNTFINNYRKDVKTRSIITRSDEISSEDLNYNPSKNQGEAKFVMADIQKALKSIPQNCSLPFLRYFEGYKYQEIADEMQIPIGTVKTRIHIARGLLKKQLKAYRS